MSGRDRYPYPGDRAGRARTWYWTQHAVQRFKEMPEITLDDVERCLNDGHVRYDTEKGRGDNRFGATYFFLAAGDYSVVANPVNNAIVSLLYRTADFDDEGETGDRARARQVAARAKRQRKRGKDYRPVHGIGGSKPIPPPPKRV